MERLVGTRYCAIALTWLIALGCAGATKVDCGVDRSIGKVIMAYDYGSVLRASMAFDEELASVRSHPWDQRGRFYWSYMMHVPLDASYVTDFLEAVLADEPELFVAMMNNFLEKPPPSSRVERERVKRYRDALIAMIETTKDMQPRNR